MDRVTKRFLRKIAEPIGMMVYVVIAFSIANFVEDLYGKWGFLAVIASMIIIPSLGMMIKLTWQMSKDEIDRENDKLMREIEGN
ncbi:MAG: hypothetical protein VW551_03785 [Euryarchaeota archaeon]|jgi:magnesium-transporting ATPase (P-type)